MGHVQPREVVFDGGERVEDEVGRFETIPEIHDKVHPVSVH